MNQDTPIVIDKLPIKPKEASESSSNKLVCSIAFGIFLSFLILLVLVTYLPMSVSLKFLSFLGGFFIIEDLHRSIKAKI